MQRARSCTTRVPVETRQGLKHSLSALQQRCRRRFLARTRPKRRVPPSDKYQSLTAPKSSCVTAIRAPQPAPTEVFVDAAGEANSPVIIFSDDASFSVIVSRSFPSSRAFSPMQLHQAIFLAAEAHRAEVGKSNKTWFSSLTRWPELRFTACRCVHKTWRCSWTGSRFRGSRSGRGAEKLQHGGCWTPDLLLLLCPPLPSHSWLS